MRDSHTYHGTDGTSTMYLQHQHRTIWRDVKCRPRSLISSGMLTGSGSSRISLIGFREVVLPRATTRLCYPRPFSQANRSVDPLLLA